MPALPPVARLSLAVSAGAALVLLPAGRPLPSALFLLPLLAVLIRPFPRPRVLLLLSAGALAGAAMAALVVSSSSRCFASASASTDLVGFLVARPLRSRGTLRVLEGPCAGERRVAVPDSLGPGVVVRVSGRWRDEPWGRVLATDRVRAVDDLGWRLAVPLARWRGRLTDRLHRLYGARAPVVAALTLARKEGLDPDLREAFARSGTAHLLAISGFHVGVIALIMVALLRRLGLPRRASALGAALGAWGYVALLGFPAAASRAALILTAVAGSKVLGRPPARWAALGTALLVLVALDPRSLAGPGFQLSFAGAAGLVAWGRGGTRWAAESLRLPLGVATVVGAGVAATAATLPVVAWHFERVSVVGIPATLMTTPLVVLALPGALLSLLADTLHPAFGSFLAGGVDLVLAVLEWTTRSAAAPGWASLWIPRTWVPVVVAAAWGAGLVTNGRVGVRARRRVQALAALSGLIVWPVLLGLQGRGTLELRVIDVGQGDALALRTPRGRWLLVDAGPPRDGDARGHPVVRELRRAGVTRLEMLVLTHPDLDHIGGGEAVLESFSVGRVVDPGTAVGKEAYVQLLETALERGIPWQEARAGDRLDLDGVELIVLNPAPDGRVRGDTESNAASVVVSVRYGAFDAVLTGDAPVEVERTILPELSRSLEVLKVGHHGSDTSTDSLLLVMTHPRVAIISVGSGNRYGHPSADVLRRLEWSGAEIHRTDREGTLRVQARRDGSTLVVGDGPGRR